MHVVGVPKTIDNDVFGTVSTFGFDTAVQTAIEAIDKLHTTAESHDRVMVLEVMGRYAGFIALHAGLAGTADVILIPEILTTSTRCATRCGGAIGPAAASRSWWSPRGRSRRRRGVGARRLHARAGEAGGRAGRPYRATDPGTDGKECRSMILGHLQRGGQPTGYDRLLATRFGGAAVRAVAEEKWGHMVALQSPHLVTIPIEEVLAKPKRVDPAGDWCRRRGRRGSASETD